MKLSFWTSGSGRLSPVLEFILNLPPTHGKRVSKDIDHLKEQGLGLLSSSKLKPLSPSDKLYELKTRIDGVTYRVIFIISGGEAMAVHALNKKSKKVPIDDIKLAKARCK